MFILLVMSIILLGLTVSIQRRIKRKYFKQAGILAPHIPVMLHLGSRQVRNEVELLDALDHMTRAEFDAIVSSDDNAISAWVMKELRNKSLGKQLRTTSKERMMLRLDKHLRKHGKNIKQ